MIIDAPWDGLGLHITQSVCRRWSLLSLQDITAPLPHWKQSLSLSTCRAGRQWGFWIHGKLCRMQEVCWTGHVHTHGHVYCHQPAWSCLATCLETAESDPEWELGKAHSSVWMVNSFSSSLTPFPPLCKCLPLSISPGQPWHRVSMDCVCIEVCWTTPVVW